EHGHDKQRQPDEESCLPAQGLRETAGQLVRIGPDQEDGQQDARSGDNEEGARPEKRDSGGEPREQPVGVAEAFAPVEQTLSSPWRAGGTNSLRIGARPLVLASFVTRSMLPGRAPRIRRAQCGATTIFIDGTGGLTPPARLKQALPVRQGDKLLQVRLAQRLAKLVFESSCDGLGSLRAVELREQEVLLRPKLKIRAAPRILDHIPTLLAERTDRQLRTAAGEWNLKSGHEEIPDNSAITTVWDGAGCTVPDKTPTTPFAVLGACQVATDRRNGFRH